MKQHENTNQPGFLSSLSDIISSIQQELAQWENNAAQAAEQCDQLYDILLESGDTMNEAGRALRQELSKKQTYIEKYQAAGQNYIHARRIYDAIQTGNHQTIEIALDYIVANYQSAYRYHFGEPICEYCQNIYERALAITPEDVQAAKKQWDQARDAMYEHSFVTVRQCFDRFQAAKAYHKEIMNAYDQVNAQSAQAAAKKSSLDRKQSILTHIWNVFGQHFDQPESEFQF
ncbi:hypothetical protein AAK706_12890 [Erysipelotrichaceae bacterium 66-17]